jgi:hypothetical protein
MKRGGPKENWPVKQVSRIKKKTQNATEVCETILGSNNPVSARHLPHQVYYTSKALIILLSLTLVIICRLDNLSFAKD